MKAILSILVIVISLAATAQTNAVVSVSDFTKAEGSWKGSLTYMDYSSGKPFSMPANVSLRIANNSQIILSYAYPNEPNANGKDTLLISSNGLSPS